MRLIVPIIVACLLLLPSVAFAKTEFRLLQGDCENGKILQLDKREKYMIVYPPTIPIFVPDSDRSPFYRIFRVVNAIQRGKQGEQNRTGSAPGPGTPVQERGMMVREKSAWEVGRVVLTYQAFRNGTRTQRAQSVSPPAITPPAQSPATPA